MLSLPIARRELLVQARSPLFYRARVTTSIVLLLLGIGFVLLYQYIAIGAVRQVVHGLGFFIVMICVFSGVTVTADCISREKRDGTLGLLFLTPLSAAEIALGKLFAGGLSLFYALLIAMPLFSLIIIAGGVGWFEVLGILLLASNVAFASAAIGLYASTVSLERKKAHGRGIWIVLFFWWLLPAAAEIVGRSQAPLWIASVLRTLAFSSMFGGPATMMRGSLSPAWTNFISTHLVGWFFVALAIYYLPRRWQEHTAKSKPTLRDWWKQVCHGKGEPRARLRFKLLNQNPFLWLADRDRTRVWHAWIVTILVIVILLVIFPGGPDQLQSFTFIVLGISGLLQLMWASAATAQLLAEQEQGTMEMLLSTPLSPREIMRGQLLALVRQYGGPVALIFGLQWLVALLLLIAEHKIALTFALLAYSFLFLFNLFVLYQVAMWSAVTVKDPKHAASTAIGQCIFLPVFALSVIGATIALLNWMGWFGWTPEGWHILTLWYLLQCVSNAFWLVVVRKSIPSKMRAWAMRRYTAEPPKLRWQLFRRLLRRTKPPANPAPAR